MGGKDIVAGRIFFSNNASMWRRKNFSQQIGEMNRNITDLALVPGIETRGLWMGAQDEEKCQGDI